MAIRLLPFRQYNEHDVINLFTLDDAVVIPHAVSNAGVSAPEQNGDHDNGVLVKAKTCNLSNEPIVYGEEAYLGKTDYPHIGRNQYPKVPHTFEKATASSEVLGVTLRQTLTHDENGEKLLYYPQKALELNAVFPGQAVPILTRGLITVSAAGLGAGITNGTAVGTALFSDAFGKFTATANGGGSAVGTLLGFGDRDEVGTNPDYFAGSGSTGGYALIKLEL